MLNRNCEEEKTVMIDILFLDRYSGTVKRRVSLLRTRQGAPRGGDRCGLDGEHGRWREQKNIGESGLVGKTNFRYAFPRVHNPIQAEKSRGDSRTFA